MENKNSFMTRKEAAQLLRVSVITLDTYIRSGVFPAYHINRRVLLKENEILDALKIK